MAYLDESGLSRLWTHIMTKLGGKVDKVDGKQLSTNDYTTTEKNKLAGIADGANKTTVDNSMSTSSTNPVQNKVVTAAINALNTLVGDESVSAQINDAITNKADSSHTHDDRYYTESEVDTKLSGKANTSHGNHVPTTETANNAKFLRNDNTWQTVTPANIGAAASSHGTHVSYSTTTPVMDGTASVGSASTVARSDHKHPTDTSRAAASDVTALQGLVGDTAVSTQIANAIAGKADSGHTHSAYVNQNAFGKVTVGSTTVAADSTTDTLTLVAGDNITLTPDTTNDKITITATDTNTTYSAGTGISLSGTTFSNSGVRSVSTGSTNGTISVNTNGTSTDVSVKGLGSAAYTASTAYDTAGAASSALSSAKSYTDSEIADWVGDTTVSAQISSAVSSKQDTITGGATTITGSNLTASRALVSNSSGKVAVSAVTSTELGYLDGVTSSIQTQLNGKAASDHTHSYAATSHTHNYAGSSSVGGAANVSESEIGITTAGSGSAYTATVSGITTLTAGVSFIMIPHTASASTAPTLNVNSLGAKTLRRRLSSLATSVQAGYTSTWLAANVPFRVTYDGTQWIVENQNKPAAADLYGTLAVNKGGTGATDAATAVANLGYASNMVIVSATEPTVVNGMIWLKPVE